MTNAEKMQLAEHAGTSAETLAGLAKDPDSFVRQAVARHPETSAETLAGLATDPRWAVRQAVARHAALKAGER